MKNPNGSQSSGRLPVDGPAAWWAENYRSRAVAWKRGSTTLGTITGNISIYIIRFCANSVAMLVFLNNKHVHFKYHDEAQSEFVRAVQYKMQPIIYTDLLGV